MIDSNPQTAVVRGYRPLTALVPAHWQAGTIDANDGTPLYYTRTGGDKPPIVLLHGVQVDGLTWLRTASALEGSYDVVMPDFRGHGRSGRVEQGFSEALLVGDTRALIEALGLAPPFVVGHSMGADIAGRLAAEYPARGVVLVDPALQNFMASMPPMGDELPPWMQPIVEAARALESLPHADRMETGLKMLPPGTPLWAEADYVSYVEGQARFDWHVYHHMARMGYLFEAPQIIAQIACPILLLTARSMMPGANIQPGLDAFATNWRSGEHIHFDDSGHAIPFDRFDRFIDVLAGFLAAH